MRVRKNSKIVAGVHAAGVLGAIVLVGNGCVSHPTEINGREVIGSRWVDGHVVYVLADNDADKERMTDSAKAADDAARTVVFHPLRPKKEEK